MAYPVSMEKRGLYNESECTTTTDGEDFYQANCGRVKCLVALKDESDLNMSNDGNMIADHAAVNRAENSG